MQYIAGKIHRLLALIENPADASLKSSCFQSLATLDITDEIALQYDAIKTCLLTSIHLITTSFPGQVIFPLKGNKS